MRDNEALGPALQAEASHLQAKYARLAAGLSSSSIIGVKMKIKDELLGVSLDLDY
jgi:hypothetical protein